MSKKNYILKLWTERRVCDACGKFPLDVLSMVQAGELTILDHEAIDVLYKLEPVQTARVLKITSFDPTPLEVLINHKLYKASQVHKAALEEPQFALDHYDNALKPQTRFQCEALL